MGHPPVGWFVASIIAAAGACGVAAAAFFFSLPRRVVRDLDELQRDMAQVVAKVEQTETRVSGQIEELSDLHDRVETKRRRTQKIAERAEQNEQPQDEVGAAVAAARAAGWNV